MNTGRTPYSTSERILFIGALISFLIAFVGYGLLASPLSFILVILILPAYFFISMPAVALWMLGTSLTNEGLRRFVPRPFSIPVSFALFTGTMILIPWLANIGTHHRYNEALADRDILPASPVKFSGHVRILAPQEAGKWTKPEGMDGETAADTYPWACDALCLATLRAPDVKSVTVDLWTPATAQSRLTAHARSFILVPRANCPANAATPVNPGGLQIDRQTERSARPSFGAMASSAAWTQWLTKDVCLVEQPARTHADQILEISEYIHGASESARPGRVERPKSPTDIKVQRVELRTASGQPLLRKTVAWTRPLTAILIPTIDVPWKGPTTLEFGRTTLSNGDRFGSFNAHQILADHTDLNTGFPALNVDDLKVRLRKLVAQQSIDKDDPALDFVQAWFGSLESGSSPQDIELVKALIKHPSIKDFAGVEALVKWLGGEGIMLRDAVGYRLLHDPEPGGGLRYLSRTYMAMPEGTFLTSTPTETAILSDPDRRRFAPGLIVRQSDRGADAVPELISILRFHLAESRARLDSGKNGRRAAEIDAVRVALCRVGPDAKSAVRDVEALLAQNDIDVTTVNNQIWLQTLVRMGKPIAEIFKPDGDFGTDDEFRARMLSIRDEPDPNKWCNPNAF